MYDNDKPQKKKAALAVVAPPAENQLEQQLDATFTIPRDMKETQSGKIRKQRPATSKTIENVSLAPEKEEMNQDSKSKKKATDVLESPYKKARADQQPKDDSATSITSTKSQRNKVQRKEQPFEKAKIAQESTQEVKLPEIERKRTRGGRKKSAACKDAAHISIEELVPPLVRLF